MLPARRAEAEKNGKKRRTNDEKAIEKGANDEEEFALDIRLDRRVCQKRTQTTRGIVAGQ